MCMNLANNVGTCKRTEHIWRNWDLAPEDVWFWRQINHPPSKRFSVDKFIISEKSEFRSVKQKKVNSGDFSHGLLSQCSGSHMLADNDHDQCARCELPIKTRSEFASPWRYRQAHRHARKYLMNNMRSVLEQGRLLSLMLNLIFGAYCPRPDFGDFSASWPPSWCVWLGTGGSSCPRQPLYWPVASSKEMHQSSKAGAKNLF